MIITPKTRGFICTNAHPEGCAANVREQITYIKNQAPIVNGPKNVLIIGSSTGYGMASRITATFGCGAKTFGVFFEKPPTERKTASAGYYNAAVFEQEAAKAGLYAKSINGDAFSNEIKAQTIAALKRDLGKVDLIVYSLASPRRTDPVTGITYSSVLKPMGKPIVEKNINTDTLEISEITLEVASEQEIKDTVKVMGGEDWELWINALKEADVLADNFQTVAYTYLGEKITWPIYGHATIGRAKEDLDRAAKAITDTTSGQAHVSVLKALVTQASSAIPIMPLYLSILTKIMKAEGTDEGCIEQLYRLFTECMYTDTPRLDSNNRFRVDNLELDPSVQERVGVLWPLINEENLFELTDFEGYRYDFLKLFGFGLEGIDYEADVSPFVEANF